MEINHFVNASTTEEFSFGGVQFTPINIDYFVRLYDYHNKDFGAIQAALANVGTDKRAEIAFIEAMVCLIHTATYPYKKQTVSTDSWKTTITGWVLRDPEFVKWFMDYYQKFMPEEKKSRVRKKS